MIERDNIEKNLARIHDWIKSSDQKISIFLAFQGVLLTLLFPLIFKWFWKNVHELAFLEVIFIAVSSVFLLEGIIKSFSAIIPRISNGAKVKSLTFFGHIASDSLGEYKKRLEESTKEHVVDDLISQTHISAGIANTKHSEFRKSMISFAIGISILVFIYIEFTISKILW